MSNAIDRHFAEKLLLTFDNPDEHGVHFLFNEWWRHAPAAVTQQYLEAFRSVPEAEAFLASGYYADPLDLDTLAGYRHETLGHSYYHFIVDNGLEAKIATNYRMLHEHMESSGALDGMPEEFKYAIIRGFQIHDFMHLLTGYDPDGPGEIALQAFTLAQMHFPYMAMWMSVLTTRMTFLEPDSIPTVMDNIAEGWQFGNRAGNIAFLEYEKMLDRPLLDIRREYGIDPAGGGALAG
ncbi:hypothetical protein F0M18_07445 [Pseudohalioglobus sediminis]|uniref:Ubiquinone biosynthesis protein n=1 Tax=Pseudohalioglobus sediminis TaxID=2606449 RepID=A0A5B0X1T8_9GAMM|nr:Coq4 family protein [Pseudohalioglobus sediminis]KAA1192497.1 hypothetical protein F0M18_07445 [Pseudohalioglobus sediminis]